MSQVDDIQRMILNACDQAEDNLDWLAANGPKIIETATTPLLMTVVHIHNPYNPLGDRAKQELAKAIAFGRTMVFVFRLEAKYMGSPDRLRAAADAIDRDVVTPARDFAHQLVLGKIPSALPSNYSDGVASEGYRAAIDGRDLAVRDIETYASPVSQALRDLADAIESFFRELRDIAMAFVALIISIVAVVLGWETVILGIAGIAGIIWSLIEIGTSISDLNTDITTKKDEVLSALNAEIPAWPAVLS